MRYCRIPASYLRESFGFMRFPDFAPETWQQVKEEADAQIRSLPEGLITGSDAAKLAVKAARINLGQLPYGKEVEVYASRFQELEPINDAVIVSNPPYGVRLGAQAEAAALVGELGSFLKHKCAGSTAYLYFGDRELVKKIGLKPAWKKPLSNGGLDGVLAKYEMY